MTPTQIGHVAGTMIGSVVVPGVGAPVGGLIGLLAGMVVQQQADQVTEKRERKELSQELKTGAPASLAAGSPVERGEPTRVWVDETVQQGRLVPGHFEVRDVPSSSG